MSETPAQDSRLGRLLELLPVFAALAFHGLTHGRWLLCVPAMGGLGAAVLLGWRPTVDLAEGLARTWAALS